RTDSSLTQQIIAPDKLSQLSKAQIMEYLDLKPAEFARLDQETLKELMQVKQEAAGEAPKDKDASLNTTSWRNMLEAHQWTGYDKPAYIWQPISQIHKYNLVPLIIGSLKTTLVALLFSVPLALAAALYVSQ